jgi:hypothetical protein
LKISLLKKAAQLLRSNYHTSLAAALAVGAEMSRRGYDVAFTLGNTPRIDLLASVPDGRPFKIQVKGISKPWGFFLQTSFLRAKIQRDLYLVVVVVARHALQEKSTGFRFFILSHADAKREGKTCQPRTSRALIGAQSKITKMNGESFRR